MLALLELKSLTAPKAADVLAESLREKILSGQFDHGTDLPSERELVEQVRLSRATVREALRILEGEGLIATRTGRKGGSAVVRPSAAGIGRSVATFIRGQRIRLQAVLEAREAIEPASARFAALHRTEDDLAQIDDSLQAMQKASEEGDLKAYVRANLDWHVAVVRASHNELLIAFITAVSESVHKATDLEGINSLNTRNLVIHAHRRVMDAIHAGDGPAAERRMARHVGAYVDHVRDKNPEAGPEKGPAQRDDQKGNP